MIENGTSVPGISQRLSTVSETIAVKALLYLLDTQMFICTFGPYNPEHSVVSYIS